MSLEWQSLLALAMLGWQELLIILVIVVIIFGGAKIAGIGKASGRAIREFKEELKGDESPPIVPASPTEATGVTNDAVDPPTQTS